jgi:hypothetical protein
MCHLISVVSAYIFGAVRNLKSTLPAVLFLLVSSFAVTAQASVVFDFEGYTANYQTDDPDTPDINESDLPDGTYALPDGEFAAYGVAGTGLSAVLQEDGATSSAMLKFEKGINSQWWSGFPLAEEYVDSDFIGDGTLPITMTVLADQDGNINLELQADDETTYVVNQLVIAGWNEVSFDVSGADASINWHKIHIRPDALGEVNNGASIRNYYFDDITFPSATIVADPIIDVVLTLDVDYAETDDGFVFLNSSLWGWVEDDVPDEAFPFPDNNDDPWVVTLQMTEAEAANFEYRWYVGLGFEDLTNQPDGSCNSVFVTSDYSARVYDKAAVEQSIAARTEASGTAASHIDTYSVCHPEDHDNDGIPDVIDTDDDNDGVLDAEDSFPKNVNFSSKEWDAPAFSDAFSGAEIDGSIVDGDGPLYTFPEAADAWAGFANKHLSVVFYRGWINNF